MGGGVTVDDQLVGNAKRLQQVFTGSYHDQYQQAVDKINSKFQRKAHESDLKRDFDDYRRYALNTSPIEPVTDYDVSTYYHSRFDDERYKIANSGKIEIQNPQQFIRENAKYLTWRERLQAFLGIGPKNS